MLTPLHPAPSAAPDSAADQLAASWCTQLAPAAELLPEARLPHTEDTLAIDALAALTTARIFRGETTLLVVPDDAWLPEISNALDIELRPLCLVLPEADFAAATTLRATLSLLKSRLSRPAPPAYADCWEAQRLRLEENAPVWRAALDWSAAGFSGGAWPLDIGILFPVLILPATQAASLQLHGQPMRDGLLILHAERMMEAVPYLRACAHRMLLLRDPRISLSRELAPIDETQRLSTELDVLVQELGDMELEFATAQAELAEFTRRYHEIIGRKLAELDQLQAHIAKHLARCQPADTTAQQHAEHARAQAEQSQRESERFAELDKERERPFTPTADLKRLFRQLAQKIHPDRAENEEDRAWRTELMSEANRAYRNADEMVLRDILEQWQDGRPSTDTAATRPATRASQAAPSTSNQAALQREIQRVQRRIASVSEQLNRLLASKLYELFAAANLARNRNRDLLQEMAEQLERQLEASRAQLAQLEPMSDEGGAF
ncbi:MAG: hypothetical protein KBD60_01820 [Sterolibacterium sp.]|jgi:hypothetical protein|nr:hypothetical protein [Sterolibacterium sp.]